VEQLERLLHLMARPGSSRDTWARIDYEFHDRVAVASKNPLFPIVLRSISEVLMRGRLMGVRLPDYQSKALHHHRNVFEAIRTGSSEKARLAMADHLREAEETMRRALAGEGAVLTGRRPGRERAAASSRPRSTGKERRKPPRASQQRSRVGGKK
jgi:DNA-binding FadR family transcriptional regulator